MGCCATMLDQTRRASQQHSHDLGESDGPLGSKPRARVRVGTDTQRSLRSRRRRPSLGCRSGMVLWFLRWPEEQYHNPHLRASRKQIDLQAQSLPRIIPRGCRRTRVPSTWDSAIVSPPPLFFHLASCLLSVLVSSSRSPMTISKYWILGTCMDACLAPAATTYAALMAVLIHIRTSYLTSGPSWPSHAHARVHAWLLSYSAF